MEPDYIEGNLFKKEEEKKEEKVKEVLQLEHAVAVEDEHYEYPPVELLSKGTKRWGKSFNRCCNKTSKNII